MDHQAKAEAAYRAVLDHFYVPDARLFRENIPPQRDDRDFSFLWPFLSVISAANALTGTPAADDSRVAALRSLLDTLEQYWTGQGYASYLVARGGGQRFYDDNAWAGLELLQAYAILKDQQLLDRTQQVFEFITTGWSDDLGGGLFWVEGSRATKNTCSNGPAAVLGLKLHEVTGDARYLDWAKRLYSWTKSCLRSPEGLYWDNVGLDGHVDARTYTYNTGIMMQADLLLRQATGDPAYLQDALDLAGASLAHFAPADAAARFFPATPWFNAVLFRAYLGLRNVTGDDAFASAMLSSLEYAWDHVRDQRGFVRPDWSGRGRNERGFARLLDQAPVAEIYALAALSTQPGGVANAGSPENAAQRPNNPRIAPVAFEAGPSRTAVSPLGTAGSAQRFATHGRYACQRYGGHQCAGASYVYYEGLGGPDGPLGFPLSDALSGPVSPAGTAGWCQRFEGSLPYPPPVSARLGVACGASVYWTASDGPYATWYEIGACYESFGGPAGRLGYPVSERQAVAAPSGSRPGYCQRFEGGAIYWSQGSGAHPVIGSIGRRYDELGGPGGRLGFPVADANAAEPDAAPSTLRQRFERGWIYLRPDGLAEAVYD